jgi:hypothetical protein
MGNPNPTIRATDDPELAKRLGLTHWDPDRGQYTAAPEGNTKAAPAAAESKPADAGGDDQADRRGARGKRTDA